MAADFFRGDELLILKNSTCYQILVYTIHRVVRSASHISIPYTIFVFCAKYFLSIAIKNYYGEGISTTSEDYSSWLHVNYRRRQFNIGVTIESWRLLKS